MQSAYSWRGTYRSRRSAARLPLCARAGFSFDVSYVVVTPGAGESTARGLPVRRVNRCGQLGVALGQVSSVTSWLRGVMRNGPGYRPVVKSKPYTNGDPAARGQLFRGEADAPRVDTLGAGKGCLQFTAGAGKMTR